MGSEHSHERSLDCDHCLTKLGLDLSTKHIVEKFSGLIPKRLRIIAFNNYAENRYQLLCEDHSRGCRPDRYVYIDYYFRTLHHKNVVDPSKVTCNTYYTLSQLFEKDMWPESKKLEL